MFFASLQPLYSLPCPLRREMTIIARDQATIDKYKFCPHSLQFINVSCDCCPILNNVDELLYPGTRGIHYANSHFDIHRNPLICLGVTWDFEKLKGYGHGDMDVFVGPGGYVARYKWNEEKEGFEVSKPFSCIVKSYDPHFPGPFLDDRIAPIGSGDCGVHGRVILSRNSMQEREERFQWNPVREQFEKISCQCDIEKSRQPAKVDEFGRNVLMELEDGKLLVRKGKKLQKLEKKIGDDDDDNKRIVIKPVVVRDLQGKSLEELQAIRAADEALYNARNYETFESQSIAKLWSLFQDTGMDETGRIGLLDSKDCWGKPKSPEREEKDEDQEVPEATEAELKIIRDQLYQECLDNAVKQSLEFQKQVDIIETDNELMNKAKEESKIAYEFQTFQKKILAKKPLKKEEEEVDWEAYNLEDDDDTVVEEDSDDSDVDYDEAKAKGPVAPESVITRDDDGGSTVSGVTDWSRFD